MNIIVGKNAGFCFGVKRAVDGCLCEINKDSKKIYCLGELVHNTEVINKLKNNGITFVDDISKIKEKNVKLIIRAHGIDKKIYKKAHEKGIEVIDFTCPFVAKIHDIVESYKKKGYYILLVGDKHHPEIIGTASYCGNHYSIIDNEDDLEIELNKLEKKGINNLLVIVQTTFGKKKFELIEKVLKERIDSKFNLVIKNTICNATSIRQSETKELSQNVDYMIIIGGKNSSNTQKLYEIAKENTKALIIETADELDVKLLRDCNNIGISAGASTPDESIDSVIMKLENEYK